MKKLFTLTLMCLLMFSGFAQDPGTLDETFGNNCVAEVDPSAYQDMNDDHNRGVHVQKDGKILILSKSRKDKANYYLCVSRVNPDGSIDETYGENGHAFFQQQPAFLNEPKASVLADDGCLYIAGHIYADDGINRAYVLCVDENGFAKTSYGENGFAVSDKMDEPKDIAMDSQGRVYLVGWTAINVDYDAAIMQRYTAQGQLDTSFGSNGSVVVMPNTTVGEGSTYFEAVQTVEDDKVLVGGFGMVPKDGYASLIWDTRMWKYNTNGTLDNTFGTNGCFVLGTNELNSIIYEIEVQSNGKYVLSGFNEIWDEGSESSRSEAYVARVNVNGSIDTSFGEGGLARYAILTGEDCKNESRDIVVAHDDQIFGILWTYNHSQKVTETQNRVYVYNLTVDGKPNEDFAGTSITPLPWVGNTVQGTSIAIQKDGKVVAAGFKDPSAASIDFVLMLSRLHTSVAPEQNEEKEGEAEITMSVEVLSSTSAEVTITPNEYTTEFFAGVLPKAQYEQYGQEFWVEYLYEYAMPYTEGGVFTYNELEKDTDYYAMAFGYNSKGEMGDVTLVEFRTQGDGCEELNAKFAVYPNPATTEVYIETFGGENAQVSILDVAGRCVKQVEMSENISVINIEDIDNGIYFIKVKQGASSSVRKLVVK